MFRPLPTLFRTGLMILRMKKESELGWWSQPQKESCASVLGTFRGPSTSGAQDRSTRKHKQWLWLPKAKQGGHVLCAVANQLCVWSSAGFATARPASTRCALPLLRTTVRSCSQAVVSGAAVWPWGLVQDWTRVPRQQRDTLLGSLWPWGCAKVVLICLSCGRRPHPQRSPIFRGFGGEAASKRKQS